MSNSIEGRTPFLDHRVIEYANGIPPSLKIKYNHGRDELVEKYVLREVSKPFITDELYLRKKHPYSTSVVHPVDGPLHSLMLDLVTLDNVEALGFLNWDRVLPMMDLAFRDQDQQAMSVIIVIAQWIVLSREFGMPKVAAPTFCFQ